MASRLPLSSAVTRPQIATVSRDLARLALTLGLALMAGWIFRQLRVPAPYMLGAVCGVWLAGSLLPALQSQLQVPRWFHVPVVLGLGTMIGAAFSARLLGHALDW